MQTIKFGTDGWRAIIADEFTVINVRRVAQATALWVLEQNKNNPQIVIGYDCRFAGELFAKEASRIFCAHGILVHFAPTYSTTPIISFAAQRLSCEAGIIITASHNPPSYNGYKVKATYGGPALVEDIKKIESLIPDAETAVPQNFEYYLEQGKIQITDIEELYYQQVRSSFDLDQINSSGLKIVYDSMFGSGQFIAQRVFPNATYLHHEVNPGFLGQAPEPLERNLGDLKKHLATHDADIAVITDGDADRIAFFDDKKRFVDAHHIILLCIKYLHEYQKQTGKVVIAFSCSEKIKRLCEHYQLPYQVTAIGFKYICDIMTKENVLVGGEESGGIAVHGHIPERDGIWIALVLIEMMSKSGKKLSTLIDEIYEITGSFYYERWDLHISDEQKASIIHNCQAQNWTGFGSYQIQRMEDIDGYKYHLDDNSWVMLRLSGTEPILRIYAESSTEAQAKNILQSTKDTVLKIS